MNPINPFKRCLLIALGLLALGLGALGVVVPLLPTTPFLLLAAWCFLRSSQRLYQWVITHPVFGEYIYHYLTYRSVKMKAKMATLLLLWPSLLASMLIVRRTEATVMLLIVGIGVTWHILALKTYRGPDDTSGG